MRRSTTRSTCPVVDPSDCAFSIAPRDHAGAGPNVIILHTGDNSSMPTVFIHRSARSTRAIEHRARRRCAQWKTIVLLRPMHLRRVVETSKHPRNFFSAFPKSLPRNRVRHSARSWSPRNELIDHPTIRPSIADGRTLKQTVAGTARSGYEATGTDSAPHGRPVAKTASASVSASASSRSRGASWRFGGGGFKSWAMSSSRDGPREMYSKPHFS